MEKEETETHVAVVVACASTRCKFNNNGSCTSKHIVIGKGGDCKDEKWRDDAEVTPA